jgi:hypothetical protein
VQLGVRERQQLQQADAAGERLGDAVHHAELLRTGDDEFAHALARIDPALQMRQQFGHALDFVEYRAAGEARQEAARIGPREGARVRVFERDVRVAGQAFHPVRGRGPYQGRMRQTRRRCTTRQTPRTRP